MSSRQGTMVVTRNRANKNKNGNGANKYKRITLRLRYNNRVNTTKKNSNTPGNILYPQGSSMPFFDTPFEITKPTEDYNQGTIILNNSNLRYLSYFPSRLDDVEEPTEEKVVDAKSLKGIIFHNKGVKPLVFDDQTKDIHPYLWSLLHVVDSTNEPIFLITDSKIQCVMAEDISMSGNGKYRDLVLRHFKFI